MSAAGIAAGAVSAVESIGPARPAGESAAALTPADGPVWHPANISATATPTDRVIQVRVAPMTPLYRRDALYLH
jgi:hypothetical protein